MYEAEDAEGLMDQWNESPEWAMYPPEEFRNHICWMTGADIELPADDDEILTAIAEACCPEIVYGESPTTSP